MTCLAPCPGIALESASCLTEISQEWDELLQHSYDNRLFLSALWLDRWMEHFSPVEAVIATQRDDDGRLAAVLPMQVCIEGGERILGLLGDQNVSDYMDGLAEKGHANRLLAGAWDCVLDHLSWDRIDLRHVPSTSALIPALQSAGDARGIEVTVERDEVCPVAILCSTWDGYLQTLTKKQRHEIRRKLRRAQQNDNWEWRTSRTHAEVDRDLESFFRLHEASARDKADFLTPAMRSYFRDVAHAYLDAGYLRLSVFSRDGVDLAATMSFLHRDRYLLYNSGYDPAAAEFSPGIAAVALAMQDAIAEQAVAFDFLSGDEPYKYQFGATNTYTCRVRAVRQV